MGKVHVARDMRHDFYSSPGQESGGVLLYLIHQAMANRFLKIIPTLVVKIEHSVSRDFVVKILSIFLKSKVAKVLFCSKTKVGLFIFS